jgi:hypothetical protein
MNIIQFIHIIVRIFLVATPFLGNDYYLTLHLFVVPFVLLHWAMNQTVCVLTLLENWLFPSKKFFDRVFTPIYKNESFVGAMLKPIYNVKDKDEEKRLVWIGMLALLFITFIRLYLTNFSYLRFRLSRLRSTPRP